MDSRLPAVVAPLDQSLDLAAVPLSVQSPVPPIPPHVRDEALTLPPKQRSLRDVEGLADFFRFGGTLPRLHHASPTTRDVMRVKTVVSILSMVTLSSGITRQGEVKGGGARGAPTTRP